MLLPPSDTHRQGGESSLQLTMLPVAEPQSGYSGASSLNKFTAWH